MHTQAHAYIHTHLRTYILTYKHANLHTYMHMRVCMYGCMYVCMYVSMYICMHVCKHMPYKTVRVPSSHVWGSHRPTKYETLYQSTYVHTPAYIYIYDMFYITLSVLYLKHCGGELKDVEDLQCFRKFGRERAWASTRNTSVGREAQKIWE